MEEIKFEKVSEGIFDKVKTNKEEFVERFIDELEDLFPDTVKDGKVDFQALLERFGEYEDRDEKHELTWVGKNKARQESFEDIVGKTLKYIEGDSKNPETTENLYIEGDNLEVLKLLRKSYYGKIKMIYIDPPYNRRKGDDLIYRDDFTLTKEEYDKLKGNVDEYGNRLVKNSSDSGRYHSNWLNMMYPRLQVARDLLTDDGVIFISIDDNEVSNLKKICDEIFGEGNCIGQIARITKKTSDAGEYFAPSIDYILCYGKSIFEVSEFRTKLTDEQIKGYNKEDDNGKYKTVGFYQASLTLERSRNARYYIQCPDGSLCIPPKNKRWRCIEETYKEKLKNNEIEFIKTETSPLYDESGNKSIWNVYTKQYLNERMVEGRVPRNYIDDIHNVKGTKELKKVQIPFDFPKPSELIKYLLSLVDYTSDNKDSIILDFFSGSATTAHAVMDLNAEDEGNRKFIMVQIPEITDEKSVAFKEGYKNICEIGKERIRRAGKKILEDNKDKEGIENLDIGFKVFRVEDTNFKRIVDTSIDADISEMKYKNIKDEEDFNPHFTDLDIVYELMLRRQDIELTEKIKRLDNIGDRTYIVGDTMVVCLEEKITEEMVENIGNIDGDISWIVLRDSAFDDDCDLKINTTKKLRTIIKESKNKDQKIYWI